RVGQILPRAGDARDHRLPSELAVGAHLAGDAGHFSREAAQLIHHRVDRFLGLQDLAPDVDGDLLRQVAVGDGDGHVRDVADLRGQVAGHLVDRFGELLPHARDALDLRLAAELAFGADLPGDTRDLRGE